jgi:hypothetical protein
VAAFTSSIVDNPIVRIDVTMACSVIFKHRQTSRSPQLPTDGHDRQVPTQSSVSTVMDSSEVMAVNAIGGV